MKKTIFTLLLLCQAAALLAQPTFLDPGFGNAGKHVFTRPAYDEVHDVVVQPDGKILVAGTSIFRYSLVRYNADGTLDTGFGTGGMNYTFWLPDGISGEIRAVALQADGKIVALGTGGLVRYLPDGQPDFSFSPPDLQYDYHFALALAPDGKIVLGGYKYSGDAHFMIKRVRPDGTKDSSFGANGVASFNFGENTRALAIAVQPDGKTLAAGYSGSGDLLVLRLKANGAPDSTFNSTGALLIDGGAGSLSSNHISLLPDGKIMVGANGSGYISFFRINPDGSLDDTFGTNGEAKLPGFIYASDVERAPDGGFWMYCVKTGSGSVIVKVSATGEPDAGFADAGVLNVVGPYYDYALAVQADSNLVAATTTLGSDFTLSRYLPNGNIDSAFHHGAPVVTNIGQSGGEVNALAVQPDDGKVVGVGAGPGPMITRLDSDGAPDSSFHARSAFISGKSGGFNALLLQPDGKILAGGGIIYQDDNGIDGTEGVLYRFLTDGALDTGFSGKPVAFIKALARQPDGKFLAAGTDEGKIGHAYYIKPRLVRYLADGSVDSMFGAAGIVVTHPCRCDLLALQPDGMILVAGSWPGLDTFMVIRYDSIGAPDPAFATNGYIREPGTVDLMALLPDGKILLAANTDEGLTLSRYHENGLPDIGFGTGGKRFLALGPLENINAMMPRPDGKILLAGEADNGQGDSDFLLARLLPDGSPDTAVGFGGFVYTDFGSAGGFNSYDYVRSLSVQPDGKIILGGTAWFYNNFYDEPKFAIARYRADLAVETQEVYGARFQTLNLAPNPAGDFLDIRLPGISGAAVAAEVYNSQGQLMLRCEMPAGQALDVRGLTPGMYALKVLAGGRVYSGTFIKQ